MCDLHRNDFWVAKLWVCRRNSEATQQNHTPLSTSLGLAPGGLHNVCPKLLRPGLRPSMSFMGSSEKLHQSSTARPSSKGAGHGDALLCPGDGLSQLKLAVQGATFCFPKGRDGFLRGSVALSMRIHAFPDLPFIYTMLELMPLWALLSLTLQIPPHPIRLNSMLHFQKKPLPTSIPRSFACYCWHCTSPANIYAPLLPGIW